MLKVSNVYVKYQPSDESSAISGIGLFIEYGERVALIGANGAGKSTLLLALCGVLTPHKGDISLCNTIMEKKTLKYFRQKVGMIFQNPDDQIFMPTVYEDVAFGLRNNKVAKDVIDAKVNAVMERLGVSHLKGRVSHKLSGGEKRLAALAGVLVMEPSVLLMDEPSSFLDPQARRRLINILSTLPQAMLLATHDLDLALDLCGRVILLKEGKIYSDAPTKEILHDAFLLEECGLELPLSLRG